MLIAVETDDIGILHAIESEIQAPLAEWRCLRLRLL
jgi:hypothetical protein